MSLRIVPDDQRLATLDVFLVVSHCQSVYDPPILGFFSPEGDVDIQGNMLGRIMQRIRHDLISYVTTVNLYNPIFPCMRFDK